MTAITAATATDASTRLIMRVSCWKIPNPKSQTPNPKSQDQIPSLVLGFGIWDLGFLLVRILRVGAAARSWCCRRRTRATATPALRFLYRAPRALDALGQVLRQRPVLGPLRRQRVADRLITLVTLVGQDRAAVERRQRKRQRERPDVGHRIVHRDLVLDDVVGDPLEPFGERHAVAVTQSVAVAADAGFVGEVGRFHDELVAFPAGD